MAAQARAGVERHRGVGIEVVWHDLKAHHLAHQTFTDLPALDQAINTAVYQLNVERSVDSLVEKRISA